MATQPDQIEDEHVEQDNELEDVADQPEGEVQQEQPQDEEEEDEIVVGDESFRGEEESEGVRNLRKRLREREQELRSLKGQQKDEEIGDKPNFDDYFDRPEEYDRDLLAWQDRKRAADERKNREQERAQRQQERWQEQEREFEDSWSGLRITGKDAARAKVEEAFDATQLALLVKAARGNAAGLFFVLGTNPERLASLEKHKDDPADFIAEAAVLAKETRVEKRKPTTQPEKQHRGGGVTSSDNKLERLEREAARTGDRTELIAYRRKQRELTGG